MRFNVDLSKIREILEKKEKKRKRERVPTYLRKCKYCKYIELIYCRYHAVTIHPESRACPAFVLREEFTTQKKESEVV